MFRATFLQRLFAINNNLHLQVAESPLFAEPNLIDHKLSY